ncbi:MAG: hypothetical protein H0X47_17340 [Nitrospirales bacterium]|nr:hypothetical protein [Nitrospirales bacterium]
MAKLREKQRCRQVWKRTLSYAGYLLLVTLPLLEMGVRMWGFAERHIYDPIYWSFEPSEDIP